MAKGFTRRRSFQALGGMAVAAGLLALSARHATPVVRVKRWREFAMEVLAGTPLARQLVIAGLAGSPDDDPVSAVVGLRQLPTLPGVSWTSEGCVYERSAQLKAAVAAVRQGIQEDLNRGRVVVAGRWVISETEATVAGMCLSQGPRLTEGRP